MLNIYPAIDIKDGKCVRLKQGDYSQITTYSDNPIDMAMRWKDEGAKWLHVVDLDGAKNGQPSAQNREVVQQIVKTTGLPIQLGGGIRTIATAKMMLEMGIARVVVGTAVARDNEFAATLFANYGEQIAVGVDAREGIVAVHGWQEHSGEKATAFVARMAQLGAKLFIFTDIARDGMLEGVNAISLAQVAARVPNIPVIASGGVATIKDIDILNELKQASAPNIDGVIVGKALYAGTVSLSKILARVT